jgi:predicted metal-dependent HD superfamily phosphohydrolase
MTNCITPSREGAYWGVITRYWQQIEPWHKPGAWEVLDRAYREDHRAYHTWEHIGRLLEKLSAFSHLATRPDLIALAAFWHDAVHQTRNAGGAPRLDSENVRDSAAFFQRYTLLSGKESRAVHDMIMATGCHLQAAAEIAHYDGFAGDLDLFLDLDLSSLALPWEEFCADLARIRREFFWVPEAAFCSAQIRILEDFAKDDARLYRRRETRQKWRDAARENLQRCISHLKGKAL